MKNLHQSAISSPIKEIRDGASTKTDKAILRNNPKIDCRLLEEYERLITPLKGVIQIKQGADYHLSHPFGPNDVPTGPREIGKRLSDIKRT